MIKLHSMALVKFHRNEVAKKYPRAFQPLGYWEIISVLNTEYVELLITYVGAGSERVHQVQEGL